MLELKFDEALEITGHWVELDWAQRAEFLKSLEDARAGKKHVERVVHAFQKYPFLVEDHELEDTLEFMLWLTEAALVTN